MSIIELKNVCFAYNGNNVLNNISLNIEQGEFVGIIGGNGSGKSTLLKLITGLETPISGTIKKKKINYSYVEQVTVNSDLTFPATVWEIVSLGLKRKWFLFLNRQEKEKIEKVLNLLNISKYKNAHINDLSGGEQQKVKLAKALVGEFDCLILDEPTCGIDKKSEEELIELINKLNREQHKTIIFVSHKLEHLGHASKIYMLNGGTLKKHRYLDDVGGCCEGANHV